MTLAEFLHPLKGTSRKEHVWAVLYFYRHYEGRDAATVADIRAGLRRGRVPWAKNANIAQELARSGPSVDRSDERGVWAITGTGEKKIRERLGLPTAEAQTDVSALRKLAQRVTDVATRDYIEEAVECLQVGARRAAVVFLWTGAVSSIRNEVWKHGAQPIEAALRKRNPKARFQRQDDFEGVKDKDLVQIAQDLTLYDKSEKRRLGEALDLRNDCGHPAKYRPGEKKVSSFVEDLLNIVFV